MNNDQVRPCSQNALAILKEEHRRTETEADAFADFCRRVENIDAARPRSDGGNLVIKAESELQTSREDLRCKSVCRAYQETVLSMAHYSEEYNELLRDNMNLEFGPEVTERVFRESRVTLPLKRALLSAGQRAYEERTTLLARLDDEADALETALVDLQEIDDQLDDQERAVCNRFSFSGLRESYEMLDDIEDRCDRLSRKRQRALHDEEWAYPNPSKAVGLQSYLYSDLDTQHPVLVDIADRYRRLRRLRSRVVRALTKTV